MTVPSWRARLALDSVTRPLYLLLLSNSITSEKNLDQNPKQKTRLIILCKNSSIANTSEKKSSVKLERASRERIDKCGGDGSHGGERGLSTSRYTPKDH